MKFSTVVLTMVAAAVMANATTVLGLNLMRLLTSLSIFCRRAAVVFSAVALLAFAIPANATTNFVTNGNFSATTGGTGLGQLNYNGLTLTGWTASADTANYFFVFDLPAADTLPGVPDSVANGSGQNDLALWGPADGSANGLTASPDGGNFVGADPDYQNSAITQTITGLTSGTKYAVTFDWAAAQQYGFTGATTEGWAVSLGSQTIDTNTVANASEGFNGWFTTTLVFTATSSSEVLSFLATGTGGAALPPFSLLDGVSMTVNGTPEPVSWALILGGLGLMGGLRVVRSKNWFRH